MSVANSDPDVPTWIVGLVLALFGGSLAYGIIVMQSITAPLMMWFGLLGVGLSLFTVYLLYRFVVAFEKIAAKY